MTLCVIGNRKNDLIRFRLVLAQHRGGKDPGNPGRGFRKIFFDGLPFFRLEGFIKDPIGKDLRLLFHPAVDGTEQFVPFDLFFERDPVTEFADEPFVKRGPGIAKRG